MSKFIFVFLFVAVAVSGIAMIETLSLEEMVASSDLVLVGRVVARKDFEVAVDEEGTVYRSVRVVANLFEVTRSLKGDAPVGARLKIRTFTGVLDFEALDQDGFYVVFLERAEGYYDIFNSPQGSWPVESNGKFGGMGLGITLEDILKYCQ